MSCFGLFKEKARGWRPLRRNRTPEKISTFTSQVTVSAPESNTRTSISDDSAATRQISKSSGSVSSPRSLPALYEERAHNLRVFNLKELSNATNDFSRILKIGQGGFGTVYRGYIKPLDGKGDKTMVAVKKLDPNGFQGHKQWVAEVQFLGVVEHPNLVKLIGYCSVDGERGIQRLLVYEFVPNKSLEDHLFNKAYPPLPWLTRLQIALGAAQGLAYLHEGLEIQIIYRDFKASNVLLDEEYKPKLSDFGLAREGPAAGDTHVSTAVMGTYGYAAPEYIETGHLTYQSDVWGFGVVLYEILTGRRSVERHLPTRQQKLVDWVKQYPVESSRFSRIIDPRLENQYSLKGAKEVAKLANSCLSKQAKDRPKMIEVVESLKLAMQFTEFVKEEKLTQDDSATEVDIEEHVDEGNNNAYSYRRRMLHLAKLGENANGVGMRRFTIMRAATPT